MYKFSMDSDPYIVNTDASWWHYSTREAIKKMDDNPQPSAVDLILDPSKTVEEAVKIQQDMIEQYRNFRPGISEEMQEQLDIQEIFVPGITEEEPAVRIKVVTPKKMPRGKRPAFLHFYGGGLIAGCLENELGDVCKWALELKAVGIAVEYRLLPAHPYPAAVNDAEAVVNYVLAHKEELRVDPERLIATGMSAGGYMATVLAQRLRIRGGYQLAGEFLMFPIIDDYFHYPSSKLHWKAGWNPRDDQRVFAALMGESYSRAAVPPDAIPIHCEDFNGMPPTVIFIGSLDYGRDPVLEYAQGIMNAGIYCDIHIWGGGSHGFTVFTEGTDMYDRAWRDAMEYMRDLMTGKCVRK